MRLQKKTNIILITTAFPYYPGEQFLETEILYYSYFNNINLKIIPLNFSNSMRDIDKRVIIDNFFVNIKLSFLKRLQYFFISAFAPLFYKELFSIDKISPLTLKSFFLSISSYQMYYIYFDQYLRDQPDIKDTTIYTYWHNEATYALQALKQKYNYQLISRIHGYDIYQERRAKSYMPLKKHFTKNIDKIYTITESAKPYLIKNYHFEDKQIALSRLGVRDLKIVSQPSDAYKFHILSCAFATNIKQLDKIIDTLYHLSNSNPHIAYEWIHIGDGILFEDLKIYANKTLKNIKNCTYRFLGHLNNKDIYHFYQNYAIDVFINTSKSEGVPVSIMEAMSCHIPIVAPNIGGISDMIENQKSGFLLSSECKIEEIVHALQNINFFKQETVRKNSYDIFLKKYNASVNYIQFIKNIITPTTYNA